MNFGTNSWTATLALIAADKSTGAVTTLDGVHFVNWPGGGGGNTISGHSFEGGVNGDLNGRFYGPNAAEYGADFHIMMPNPSGQDSNRQEFWGIAVGKKN